MQLNTIVRRFTRRAFPNPFSNGINTHKYGYLRLDPDTGSLHVDIEEMYAGIVSHRPHKDIDFNSVNIIKDVDRISDFVEDYLQQYLYSIVKKDLLWKINSDISAIVRNNSY